MQAIGRETGMSSLTDVTDVRVSSILQVHAVLKQLNATAVERLDIELELSGVLDMAHLRNSKEVKSHH